MKRRLQLWKKLAFEVFVAGVAVRATGLELYANVLQSICTCSWLREHAILIESSSFYGTKNCAWNRHICQENSVSDTVQHHSCVEIRLVNRSICRVVSGAFAVLQ